MQSMNESAVWERVTAAGRSSGGETHAPAPVGPDLLSALEREQENVLRYQALAARTSGERQRALREVLQLSRQQNRALSALYFFLTGQRPGLAPAAPARPARQSFPDALRELLRREELSLGRLESLASRCTGEARETLLSAAQQDHRQFQLLLSLLGKSLEE